MNSFRTHKAVTTDELPAVIENASRERRYIPGHGYYAASKISTERVYLGETWDLSVEYELLCDDSVEVVGAGFVIIG